MTIDGVSHVVVGVLPAGVDALAGVPAAAWPALAAAAADAARTVLAARRRPAASGARRGRRAA